MSVRFSTNFLVLLFGAATLIVMYALGRPTVDWVSVGAGAGAVLLALYSFASRDQGVYQRLADPLIAAVGIWAIVAARVMDDRGRWLIFSAAAGLLVLGALGLMVREVELNVGLRVGRSRIGPDEYARLSALQRRAETRP